MCKFFNFLPWVELSDGPGHNSYTYKYTVDLSVSLHNL